MQCVLIICFCFKKNYFNRKKEYLINTVISYSIFMGINLLKILLIQRYFVSISKLEKVNFNDIILLQKLFKGNECYYNADIMHFPVKKA